MPEVLTRASHCFFTDPQLMQTWKHHPPQKPFNLLFRLYWSHHSHCYPIPSLLFTHAAGGHSTEGHHRGVRPLPAAWCGFAWLTLGWSAALCGFAHWDSPCSRMYFTISPFPVMAAWCNKEQWSGPWINKLAPFLQHSMNWKREKRERKKTYRSIRWEEQKNKYVSKFFTGSHCKSVPEWTKIK